MTHSESLITPDLFVHQDDIATRGDCGVVLKSDGTFRIFSIGSENVTAENVTSAQKAQGAKLLALVAALRKPELMSILLEACLDPSIIDQEKVIDYGRRH